MDALLTVHSSDPATVFLTVGARLGSPEISVVERALYQDRSLVRHHAFRRTLWVMAPATADAAHSSATAKIAAAERRTLLRIVTESPEIPADTPEQAADWCGEALEQMRAGIEADGPMTTREIGRRLPHLTVPLTLGAGTKHVAQAAAHTRILLLAGFEAELVRTKPASSWNSAEYAWANAGVWLARQLGSMAVADASAVVLQSWLERFGPATESDMRWWTGWTLTQLRRALDDIEAEPVDMAEDGPGWVAAGDHDVPDPGTSVALLPGLDATTMGWKERSWYLSSAAEQRTFDRWGNAGPTIWRNGEVIGGWAQRDDGTVAYELFADLGVSDRQRLDDEIERFRAFVGNTRVRVRFPAANQRELLSSSRGS